jgi:hypothetical protein
MPVNPAYSEGRDQEDHSSKAAWASRLRDPISKIPNTAGRQWLMPVILATQEAEIRRIVV